MMILREPLLLRLHVIAVIQDDPALLQRFDVLEIAVIVEAKEYIGFIAGAQHFPGANAHLEDRGTTRDRTRNRHEGHHFLLAAAGEPREEAAKGLDAVLRISG